MRMPHHCITDHLGHGAPLASTHSIDGRRAGRSTSYHLLLTHLAQRSSAAYRLGRWWRDSCANLLVALSVAGAGWAGWAGCAETPGEYTQFDLQLQPHAGGAAATAPFTTASGWTVELHSARAALGPLYLYGAEDISPIAAIWRQTLAELSPVRTAHAHVSVDTRPIVGEALVQGALDAAAASGSDMGTHTAIAGSCATAELGLYPAGSIAVATPGDATLLDALDGAIIALTGVAARTSPGDGSTQTVPFSARLMPDDLPTSITKISADFEMSADTNRIAFRVDMKAWLDAVDFSTAASADRADAEGYRAFEIGSPAWLAFRHGVQSARSYEVQAEE